MNSHPTIVHAAADFHRKALLMEAAEDRSTAPTSARIGRTGPGKACFGMVACLVRVASRVIDDFEPVPSAISQR